MLMVIFTSVSGVDAMLRSVVNNAHMFARWSCVSWLLWTCVCVWLVWCSGWWGIHLRFTDITVLSRTFTARYDVTQPRYVSSRVVRVFCVVLAFTGVITTTVAAAADTLKFYVNNWNCRRAHGHIGVVLLLRCFGESSCALRACC